MAGMNATRTLPPGYQLCLELDLSKNGRLLVWLNLAGLALLVPAGWLLLRLTARLRPEFSLTGWLWDDPAGALLKIAALLAGFTAVIVIHELIHGLFFWIFTGERALYGFRGAYAFAAAPGWYIPRRPYLVVALSPLVGITLAGALLIPWVSPFWLGVLIISLLVNISGAIGDLAVAGWLLHRGRGALVNDHGDALTAYCPAEAP